MLEHPTIPKYHTLIPDFGTISVGMQCASTKSYHEASKSQDLERGIYYAGNDQSTTRILFWELLLYQTNYVITKFVLKIHTQIARCGSHASKRNELPSDYKGDSCLNFSCTHGLI